MPKKKVLQVRVDAENRKRLEEMKANTPAKTSLNNLANTAICFGHSIWMDAFAKTKPKEPCGK